MEQMCSEHGESFRILHQKLDAMIERQIDYAQTSARIEAKQEQIEKIVTNGLSHSISNLSQKFDKFSEDVKKRLSILESFKWFSLPITKLRDKIFWFAIGGGILYSVLEVIK